MNSVCIIHFEIPPFNVFLLPLHIFRLYCPSRGCVFSVFYFSLKKNEFSLQVDFDKLFKNSRSMKGGKPFSKKGGCHYNFHSISFSS